MNISSAFNNGTMMITNEGSGDTTAFVDRTMNTIWNFPEGENVKLGGASQLPGSVLVPNDNSLTEIETSLNGRAYLAGNVEHGKTSSGLEIHNYPFKAKFDCGYEPPSNPGPDPDPDPNPDQEEPVQVTPVDPVVSQATCGENGESTEPSIELPTSDEIDYSVNGKVEAGNEVTIVATPKDGFELTEKEGWTLQADGTSTKTIALANTDCEVPVDPEPVEPEQTTPVDPVVSQATCGENGESTEPSIKLPTSDEIDYSVTGTIEAGKEVTIVATPKDGFELTEKEGWTLQEDGTATKTVVLDNTDCEAPVEPEPTPDPVEPETNTDPNSDPEPTNVDGKVLPNTATNNFNLLLAGATLMFVGGILFFIVRRRKSLNQ